MVSSAKQWPWGKVGAFLGGVAALVAILSFFGIATISDLRFPIFGSTVKGHFVGFRDTDLQMSLQNVSSDKHYISNAELTLNAPANEKKVMLDACCGVSSNILEPGADEIVFFRARDIVSNFAFYHTILLPLSDKSISGSIGIDFKNGNDEVLSLKILLSETELTSWKDEKVAKFHAMCDEWPANKPQACLSR